jgi:SAM-dependent methyltransferase
MTEEEQGWTEGISDLYTSIAPIAVPARTRQLAIVATLVPFGPEDAFRIVELASGEGLLAATLLGAFPRAEALALDGSQGMREATAARMERFGARARVADFDLHSDAWFGALDGADVVVSSLAVHHLDRAEKRRLFEQVAARLNPGGALLLADIVLPQRPEGNEVAAALWDEEARRAARDSGAPELFDRFEEAEWNLFRHPDPEFDKPDPLFDQLGWLRDAGFESVDCFWLTAGHAIYGGYLPGGAPGERLTYERAREASFL